MSKLLKVCVVTLLVSGCALKPDLGEAPKPRAIDTYATSSLKAAATPWPAARWWDAYGDAQLGALIDEALANAATLDEAEARVRLAEGVSRQTGALLYPSLSANGALSKLRQTYNMGVPVPEGYKDVAATTLDMSFQLDFWGKNRALVAAATSEAEAARLERDATRLVVATSVAAAYADLAQLYANLDAANDALNVRSKSAQLVKERQENGLENKGSYEQEVALRAATEAEIESLNETIDLTKNRIAALLGQGPDRAFGIKRPDIQKIAAFGLPDNLPAELLGRRPDIVAARKRVEAMQSKTDAAEANFYPNINLVGSMGQQAMGLDNFTAAGSWLASVGPTVSLPLFDGGLRAGQYRQARAGYDIAVAGYNATLQNALREVADVMTSEKRLTPRLAKTEVALKASEEAYTVINNRYKGGLTAYLAVLRSEDALIASRRALADLRTRAFTLDIALIRALGGGFTQRPE
jgi:NodT family efflux transporter outer membrane factor (OMF) lipoprotein